MLQFISFYAFSWTRNFCVFSPFFHLCVFYVCGDHYPSYCHQIRVSSFSCFAFSSSFFLCCLNYLYSMIGAFCGKIRMFLVIRLAFPDFQFAHRHILLYHVGKWLTKTTYRLRLDFCLLVLFLRSKRKRQTYIGTHINQNRKY